MVRPILEFPDPRLRAVSQPVKAFDTTLHSLIDDMFETMQAANGIGLAAPQVDQRLRVFVIDLTGQEGGEPVRQEFINPVLREMKNRASFEEGCLSVPGVGASVVRKGSVTVDYQDRHGRKQVLRAEGLLAVAIQHENDHLDGVLFVDRLSPLKRHWIKRKLSRQVTL